MRFHEIATPKTANPGAGRAAPEFGAWPAKGGHDGLTPAMTPTAALPLSFSPLP